MATISTPLGRWPVSEDGECGLEGAIQTGERYSFKVERNGGDPITFTGAVRRARNSATDYVLETGSTEPSRP